MQKMDWQALLIKEGGLDKYLERMARKGVWGDGIMIEAAALLYRRPIVIVSSNGSAGEQRPCIEISTPTQCSVADAITLGYCGYSIFDWNAHNHYVSLYTDHPDGNDDFSEDAASVPLATVNDEVPTAKENKPADTIPKVNLYKSCLSLFCSLLTSKFKPCSKSTVMMGYASLLPNAFWIMVPFGNRGWAQGRFYIGAGGGTAPPPNVGQALQIFWFQQQKYALLKFRLFLYSGKINTGIN